MAVLVAGYAHAGVLTVKNTNDKLAGSLRQAIQDAASGDTIRFQIPASDPNYDARTGIFTVQLDGNGLPNGELEIAKTLTIDGAGQKIVVHCTFSPGSFRIFHITSGTVEIANLTVSDGYAKQNNLAGVGGGVVNEAVLLLRNCTLSGNGSDGNGGAIYNSGTLTVRNCTLTRNYTNFAGAAIYNTGTLSTDNSTISLNGAQPNFTPPPDAAVYNTTGHTVHIRNTIIVGNASISASKDVEGTFASEGYNLVGTTTGSTGFGTTGDQLGATKAQVNLGPLQDNGGLTLTMKPAAESVAIDQGNRGVDANNEPINTDQRGQPRPVDLTGLNAVGGDGSDIGAVEAGLPQTGPTFTVTNTDVHNDDCTNDDCTMLEAITAANASSDTNTIKFGAGVTGTIFTPGGNFGFSITNPVTINGPGARVLTINGDTLGRVFTVTSSAGTVAISGLTLTDGAATGAGYPGNCGGAIFNSASLVLSGCTLSSSSSVSHGGAIYNNGVNGNAMLTVVDCTFFSNYANGSGGGILNAGNSGHGVVDLTNCTFEQNIASGAGGAIYNDGTVSGNVALTLTNCTLDKNNAGSGAGGIYNDALNPESSGVATVTLRNTILRAGIPSLNLYNDSDGGGTITSQGHNLSDDSAGGDGATTPGGFLNVAGDIRNTDPMLDTLKNNGGPTDTIALLSGSAAINAGNDANAPSTDQRGYFRSGVSDIGAFEVNGIVPVLPSVTTGAATNVTSTTATLNAAVNPNGLSTSFTFASDFRLFTVQNAGNGTKTVPFKVNVIGLTPGTQYHFNAMATNAAGTVHGVQHTFTTLRSATPTPTPKPTPTATPSATPARSTLGNISTRLRVETGDNVLIGGFIVTGTQPKKVILRAIGPSLPVSDALQNPLLELHGPSSNVTLNDNWVDAPNKQAIIDTTVAPSKNLESAILTTLPAHNSAYTAVVRGVTNGTGVGLVEVFDLDRSVDSELANISTRGLVQTGENVMIGGFIVLNGKQKVIVRAIGPSLPVAGALQDPVLELHNSDGAVLQSNDNWKTGGQQAEIIATTVPPTRDEESAIVRTLVPGNYTAVVRGVNQTTGVALVEVFALQ
jgi:predicted outer membrane repeat protein